MTNNTLSANQIINHVVQVLVIIGAINWGLIGLLNIDLVKLIFTDLTLVRATYTAVGIAGTVQLFRWLSSFSSAL